MKEFNNKNLIKPRQICFIFLTLVPVTKIIGYPAFVFSNAESGFLIPIAMNFLLDILLLTFILIAAKRLGETTFYNATQQTLGTAVAKITFALYSVYFFLKAVFPLSEQKFYIENTLYEIMPAGITFYPFFIISFYASLKGLKIFGRCSDLTIFLVAAGLALAIGLGISSVDLTEFLPFFEKPFPDLAKTSLSSLVYFGDSLYMLFFIGHYRKEKHSGRNMILSYGGAALATIIFVSVFCCIYGPISGSQPFALPAATVFSVNATNAARFDYLAVFLLLFAQVNAVIFPLFVSAKCLERVLGTKKSLWCALAVNLAAAIAIIFFSEKTFMLQNVTEEYLSYFFAFVSFVLTPIILSIVSFRFAKKQPLQNQEAII